MIETRLIKKKKVWAVLIENNKDMLFSTKENAIYFRDTVYHDHNVEIGVTVIDLPEVESSFIDYYKQGPFVYYITHIIPDKWETIFTGYSMDLTDQRDIVFEIKKDVFSVVSIAPTYGTAMNQGIKSILTALDFGPFNGNYTKPGYIKCYADDPVPWEETPETYLT